MNMLLRPRLSEKTYQLSQTANTYVFRVPLDANKLTVKQAVEAQFKVAVQDVNMVRKKGKNKRSLRKRSQPRVGQEVTVKKAYVTLKQGEKITIFEEGA